MRLRGSLLLRGADDQVDRLLRRSCGLDDQLAIALQRLQPVLDVTGVVLDVDVDASLAAQERCSHLRDKLLAAVVGRAERCRLDQARPRQARLMTGRVCKLMEER